MVLIRVDSRINIYKIPRLMQSYDNLSDNGNLQVCSLYDIFYSNTFLFLVLIDMRVCKRS